MDSVSLEVELVIVEKEKEMRNGLCFCGVAYWVLAVVMSVSGQPVYLDLDASHVGDIGPEWRIVDYEQSEYAMVKRVEVERAGEVVFGYEREEIGTVLTGSALVKLEGTGVLLVTMWSQGAHGAGVRVFDLEGDLDEILQCSFDSSWPFDMEVDGRTLVAHTRSSSIDPATGEPAIRRATCNP